MHWLELLILYTRSFAIRGRLSAHYHDATIQRHLGSQLHKRLIANHAGLIPRRFARRDQLREKKRNKKMTAASRLLWLSRFDATCCTPTRWAIRSHVRTIKIDRFHRCPHSQGGFLTFLRFRYTFFYFARLFSHHRSNGLIWMCSLDDVK